MRTALKAKLEAETNKELSFSPQILTRTLSRGKMVSADRA